MIQLYTPSPCPSHWMLRDRGQHFQILSRKQLRMCGAQIFVQQFSWFFFESLQIGKNVQIAFLYRRVKNSILTPVSFNTQSYIFVSGILNVCIFCVEHMLNEWQVIFQMHICCIIYSFDLCSIIMFITQCRLISLVTRIPLV